MDIEAEFQAARVRIADSIDAHVVFAQSAVAEVCASLRPRSANVFLSRSRGQKRRRERERLAKVIRNHLSSCASALVLARIETEREVA